MSFMPGPGQACTEDDLKKAFEYVKAKNGETHIPPPVFMEQYSKGWQFAQRVLVPTNAKQLPPDEVVRDSALQNRHGLAEHVPESLLIETFKIGAEACMKASKEGQK